MRYVTVVIYPDVEALHPVERRLANAEDCQRVAIHALEGMEDGTIALLAEVAGNLDRYREIVESEPSVYESTVSGEERGYCFSRVASTPATRQLLAAREEAPFVVQLPIRYTADGGQRVTLVGREGDFADAPLELPEGFEMELVSTGPFEPDVDDGFAALTDRQREVLRTAVRLGYYENPREATQAEVAAELGVEPGTVGKHLRSVESRIFSRYVG